MLTNGKLSEPLVSVVIPTYNRPEYLKQAIASAVNQSLHNIEIIVSDNCSPENPQALIDSFQDERIRFYRQEKNLGMLPNQLNAFKMARGKYVASLHDDDLWHQDFLSKLVPHLEDDHNLILAFCDQYVIDSDSKIHPIATEKNTRSYRYQLSPGIHHNFLKIGLINKSIPTAAACVLRNGVINWDLISPEVGGMWDLYLTYLCAVSGYSAYYVPEKLTYYREHEQTDTMQSGSKNAQAKIRKAKSELFCYQVFMEDERLKEFHDYFKIKWLEANTTLGIGLLRDKQINAARPYFLRALKEQKFNLRTVTALILSFIPPIVANKLLCF